MSLLSWLALFSDQLFQFASCLCFQQQRSYWGKNRAGSLTALLSFCFPSIWVPWGRRLLTILQCVLLCFLMICYGDCMLLIYVVLGDFADMDFACIAIENTMIDHSWSRFHQVLIIDAPTA